MRKDTYSFNCTVCKNAYIRIEAKRFHTSIHVVRMQCRRRIIPGRLVERISTPLEGGHESREQTENLAGFKGTRPHEEKWGQKIERGGGSSLGDWYGPD